VKAPGGFAAGAPHTTALSSRAGHAIRLTRSRRAHTRAEALSPRPCYGAVRARGWGNAGPSRVTPMLQRQRGPVTTGRRYGSVDGHATGSDGFEIQSCRSPRRGQRPLRPGNGRRLLSALGPLTRDERQSGGTGPPVRWRPNASRTEGCIRTGPSHPATPLGKPVYAGRTLPPVAAPWLDDGPGSLRSAQVCPPASSEPSGARSRDRAANARQSTVGVVSFLTLRHKCAKRRIQND
jgi:hypothetical protein